MTKDWQQIYKVTMNKKQHHQLQRYIHDHIPLSATMGIEVIEASPHKVILKAPLALNTNHKKTAFGGSLHAIATLSCWSLIYLHLEDYPSPTEIVISHSDVKYLAPVHDDFTAECHLEDLKSLDHFEEVLSKKGKSRLKLKAQIHQNGKLALDYNGDFVAIRQDKPFT